MESLTLDDSTTHLGDPIDTWTYSTSDAYFKKYPIEHLQGRTLLGLFFTKEDFSDAQFCILPNDFAKNEIIADSINLYSREFLLKSFGEKLSGIFNEIDKTSKTEIKKLPCDISSISSKDVFDSIKSDSLNKYEIKKPVYCSLDQKAPYGTNKDPLFVALICEGAGILTSFKLMTETTIKKYVANLIDFLNFWNKYNITSLNEQVKNAIERLLTMIIVKNDKFWSNLKDDLTSVIANRRFNFAEVKESKDNTKELTEIKDAIAEIKRWNQKDGEYDFKFLGNKSYDDISKFLIKPLSLEEYYSTITREQFYIILLSTNVLGKNVVGDDTNLETKILLLRIFAVFACSFDYYHLLLSKVVLDTINRINEPLIVSHYTKYLLYMMYKEETIYKTYSNATLRHIIPREISSRLKLILANKCASIVPANVNIGSIYTSSEDYSYVTIDLGRGIYNSAEVESRMKLFTNKSDFIVRGLSNLESKFAKGTKIYVLGSIITASSTRFLRDVTLQEFKECKFNDQNDLKYYKENYKNSDIDIAIYTGDDKDLPFKHSVDVIYDELCKIYGTKNVKIAELKSDKYRVISPDLELEIFKMYYDNPFAMVYNFHLPCVRSIYDAFTHEIYDFPSFIYSGLTGIQLDFRYFASEKTQLNIINKYEQRGFLCLLNKYERELLYKIYGYPDGTSKCWYMNLKTIATSYDIYKLLQLLDYRLPNRLPNSKFLPICRRIHKMIYSASIYSVNMKEKFWNAQYRLINVPRYPGTYAINHMDDIRHSGSGITREEILQLLRNLYEESLEKIKTKI